MGWDHNHYLATCKKCGRTGEKIKSSDDFNRSEISWNGFMAFHDFQRHEILVSRKRIDQNEYAICECGSTEIEIGPYIRRT